MREIEFRAWSAKRKRFLYLNFGAIVDEPHLKDWNLAGAKEQYTGLKDKNGKEIYEGDILETCCGKAVVYFDYELLMYKIMVKHGGTMPLVGKKSIRHFDYEVIGNEHEDPELLNDWKGK